MGKLSQSKSYHIGDVTAWGLDLHPDWINPKMLTLNPYYHSIHMPSIFHCMIRLLSIIHPFPVDFTCQKPPSIVEFPIFSHIRRPEMGVRGVLKMVAPQNHGFQSKNVMWMVWEYPHFEKPPQITDQHHVPPQSGKVHVGVQLGWPWHDSSRFPGSPGGRLVHKTRG